MWRSESAPGSPLRRTRTRSPRARRRPPTRAPRPEGPGRPLHRRPQTPSAPADDRGAAAREVPHEGVDADAEVPPRLERLRRQDEGRVGPIALVEPGDLPFERQGDVERVVDRARPDPRVRGEPEPETRLVPLELLRALPLSLDVLRARPRKRQAVERRDRRDDLVLRHRVVAAELVREPRDDRAEAALPLVRGAPEVGPAGRPEVEPSRGPQQEDGPQVEVRDAAPVAASARAPPGRRSCRPRPARREASCSRPRGPRSRGEDERARSFATERSEMDMASSAIGAGAVPRAVVAVIVRLAVRTGRRFRARRRCWRRIRHPSSSPSCRFSWGAPKGAWPPGGRERVRDPSRALRHAGRPPPIPSTWPRSAVYSKTPGIGATFDRGTPSMSTRNIATAAFVVRV